MGRGGEVAVATRPWALGVALALAAAARVPAGPAMDAVLARAAAHPDPAVAAAVRTLEGRGVLAELVALARADLAPVEVQVAAALGSLGADAFAYGSTVVSCEPCRVEPQGDPEVLEVRPTVLADRPGHLDVLVRVAARETCRAGCPAGGLFAKVLGKVRPAAPPVDLEAHYWLLVDPRTAMVSRVERTRAPHQISAVLYPDGTQVTTSNTRESPRTDAPPWAP